MLAFGIDEEFLLMDPATGRPRLEGRRSLPGCPCGGTWQGPLLSLVLGGRHRIHLRSGQHASGRHT